MFKGVTNGEIEYPQFNDTIVKGAAFERKTYYS